MRLVQSSYWCHLLANIKIYKSCHMSFCTSSHDFRYINLSNFHLKNRSTSWCTMITMRPFDDKHQNLQKSSMHFRANCNRFRDIIISNFLLSKTRPRSLSQIFVKTSCDGKLTSNLQKSLLASLRNF